ncbi:MAG TPA: M56 family metallopeptidase [Sphingomicrobium sp.]
MIAEILFEAAWKSMIVAGGLVALLILMARQTPANRVSVGGLGFALLMLLPAAVWGLAFYPLPLFEVAAPVAPAIDPALLLGAAAMPAATDAGAAPSGYSYQELAVAAWLTGAAALVFRLGSGLLTLRHWAKRAELAEFPSLNRIMVAGGVPRSTRLLVSEDINAPLSFGWRRPLIMIDRTTLADLAQAEAAIAHEAAHLSRGDWPRLIVARLVVSIFWFNPFVWLLERLYLQDVEEAADAEATRMVEPAVYAQALLNVARGTSVPVGANSIASGTLSRRIRKVLTGRSGSRWDRTWRIGALAGVAAVAGPIALLQFAAPAVSAVAEPVLAPVAAIVSPTPAVPAAAPSPATAPTPAAPTALVSIAPLAATPPTAPVARVAPTAPVARVAQATPRGAGDCLGRTGSGADRSRGNRADQAFGRGHAGPVGSHCPGLEEDRRARARAGCGGDGQCPPGHAARRR